MKHLYLFKLLHLSTENRRYALVGNIGWNGGWRLRFSLFPFTLSRQDGQ